MANLLNFSISAQQNQLVYVTIKEYGELVIKSQNFRL